LNEHVETAEDAPADAMLVVSKDAPKLEEDRKAAKSKAKAGLQVAKAREAALETELAGAVARAVEASSKAKSASAIAQTAAAELAAAIEVERARLEAEDGEAMDIEVHGALLAASTARTAEADIAASVAGAAEADKVRVERELEKARVEQERFTAEIDRHSRPSTTKISFMLRLRAGELSDEARLAGAMLVPGEGDPIPLRFEGGNAGRSVAMSAEVPLKTTVYVALHLVGLAGVAVEVVLLGGGSIMSVHA
jgi:hypothetical protein